MVDTFRAGDRYRDRKSGIEFYVDFDHDGNMFVTGINDDGSLMMASPYGSDLVSTGGNAREEKP